MKLAKCSTSSYSQARQNPVGGTGLGLEICKVMTGSQYSVSC